MPIINIEFYGEDTFDIILHTRWRWIMHAENNLIGIETCD